MNTTTLDVANTILAQLGGSRFLAMTGARNLLGDATSLQFKLPRGLAKDGCNFVHITLDVSADTYTVRFAKLGRAPKFTVTELDSVSSVHADSLRHVFTVQTGLDVTL